MSGNFEVCPVGTVARLAAVEAEREALKADNERLNAMLSAANWNRAQSEHNALRAKCDALVKERDEDRRREYGYSQQVVDALTNERDALRVERDALLSLIADDAFAASFQSLAQYRGALLKATKGGGNG